MKKQLIILITVVIISFNVSAQKDTTAPKQKIDSNSIPLLSPNDIYNYLNQISETTTLSPKQFSVLMQIMQTMIATKQKELSQPKKK